MTTHAAHNNRYPLHGAGVTAKFDTNSPFKELLAGSRFISPLHQAQEMIEVFPELRANGWGIHAGHGKNGIVRVFGVVHDASQSLELGARYVEFANQARLQLEAQGYAGVHLDLTLYSDERGKIPFEPAGAQSNSSTTTAGRNNP